MHIWYTQLAFQFSSTEISLELFYYNRFIVLPRPLFRFSVSGFYVCLMLAWVNYGNYLIYLFICGSFIYLWARDPFTHLLFALPSPPHSVPLRVGQWEWRAKRQCYAWESNWMRCQCLVQHPDLPLPPPPSPNPVPLADRLMMGLSIHPQMDFNCAYAYAACPAGSDLFQTFAHTCWRGDRGMSVLLLINSHNWEPSKTPLPSPAPQPVMPLPFATPLTLLSANI